MTKNQLLLDIVEDVDFFLDKNDREIYYAEYSNAENKREFCLLDSEKFKGFLYAKSFENPDYEKVLDPNRAIKELRYLLSYYKEYKTVPIYKRIAGNLDEYLEYDLQNNQQESVKVTSKGWKISAKKMRFAVPKISLPQVNPVKTTKSPLELLEPFVNIKGDSYILFLVWLIQAFFQGSHHALLIYAEKGSGKTTLSKMIRQIIDPCKFEVTTIPDRKDDLVTLLYNSFLCCFDNVSYITNDESDIFCGAVTGTAVTKRSLYTNGELAVANLHNTIVFNGIGVVPGRDDLAERMLLIKLKKLISKDLKREKNLKENFKKALPEILGSIFNTLSAAMQEIKNINEKNPARMADSFVEMLAIAKALGITEEDFRKIYADNVEELNRARVSSPLLEAIKECFDNEKSRKISGKAESVFRKIYENFSGDKATLPTSASHFSRKLDEEYANLLKAGFRVNIDDTGATGTEISIIRKKK